MNKYIIKNCPCLYRGYRSDYECDSKGELCEEVTNCLLKQIVGKCLDAMKRFDNNEFYEDDLDFFMGKHCGAEEILDLLEIQECE